MKCPRHPYESHNDIILGIQIKIGYEFPELSYDAIHNF
jgi:hypothetical protein